MADDNDDDESYVSIGAAFDIPDEKEKLKTTTKGEDQIAVDDRGRRRFHGAFTGGFSAGYFNTVGSKEGWEPATFKSSRQKRNEKKDNNVMKPEDFMDEEDFADHGIAPRKLHTTNTFQSTEQELSLRKRQFQKQVDDGDISSSIPGGLPLDDLIVAAKLSIGMTLLKKMGWKPGQGVGEKNTSQESFEMSSSKKVYGCPLPPQKECNIDRDNFIHMLAPKDVQAVLFDNKDNMHGLGYSGINPMTALFGGSNKTEETRTFRPSGVEKKGIGGQAFGVGVFEEEDDNIYGHDALSSYDLSMDINEKETNYGWSGAPKKEIYKGCLAGFIKSKSSYKPHKSGQRLQIPAGYIPKHYFDDTTVLKVKKELNKPGNENESSKNSRLSSNDRSLLLGEKVQGLEDVNKWALKWDDRTDAQNPLKEHEKSNLPSIDKDETRKSRFSTRWDKESHQERPNPTTEFTSRQTESSTDSASTTQTPMFDDKSTTKTPMYDTKSGTFKPFVKNPDKQLRYEQFLQAQKQKTKLNLKYDGSVTEWERKRELDEFKRASILYRPLNTSISNRFTRAGIITSEVEDGKKTDLTDFETDKSDDTEAAKIGMYGKLTRTVLEWYPDKLVCKRFNIPDPYPNSKRKGVPGRAKKTNTFFTDQFFDDSKMLLEEAETEKDLAEVVKTQPVKTKSTKINILPLSHLNKDSNEQRETNLSITNTVSEPSGLDVISEKVESSKPTLDIFQAIFNDSDSESESEDESEPVEKTESRILSPHNNKIIVANTIKNFDINNGSSSKNDHREGNKKIQGHSDSNLPLSFLNYDENSSNSRLKIESLRPNTLNENSSTSSTTNSSKCQAQRNKTFQDNSKNIKEEQENERSVKSHRVSNHGKSNILSSNTYQKHSQDMDDEWEENKDSIKSHQNSKHGESNILSSSIYSKTSPDMGNEWEENKNSTSHHSKSKHKHKSKHKKHKKDEYNEGEKKKKKKSKSKKKKEKQYSSSDNNSDNETLLPSNAELLNKLKKYTQSAKRPSASDFM